MRAHYFCMMSFMDAWHWKSGILSLLWKRSACGIPQWAERSDANSGMCYSQVNKVTLHALAGKETIWSYKTYVFKSYNLVISALST